MLQNKCVYNRIYILEILQFKKFEIVKWCEYFKQPWNFS